MSRTVPVGTLIDMDVKLTPPFDADPTYVIVGVAKPPLIATFAVPEPPSDTMTPPPVKFNAECGVLVILVPSSRMIIFEPDPVAPVAIRSPP